MKSNDILKKPVLSEKALDQQAKGKIHFWVDRKATKNQIQSAFFEVFAVMPTSVNTFVQHRKDKTNPKTRKPIPIKSLKKAVITLKKGDKVDIFTPPKKNAKK